MARHRLTAPRLSFDDRVELVAGWVITALLVFPIVTVIDGVTAHGVIRALGIPA